MDVRQSPPPGGGVAMGSRSRRRPRQKKYIQYAGFISTQDLVGKNLSKTSWSFRALEQKVCFILF